jgi:hypothetical protein
MMKTERKPKNLGEIPAAVQLCPEGNWYELTGGSAP